MIKPTLIDVYNQFRKWRAARTNPKETIPERIWSQALILSEEESIAVICKTLNLNPAKYRQCLLECGTQAEYGTKPAL